MGEYICLDSAPYTTQCLPNSPDKCKHSFTSIKDDFVAVKEIGNFFQIATKLKTFSILKNRADFHHTVPPNGRFVVTLHEDEKSMVGSYIINGRERFETSIYAYEAQAYELVGFENLIQYNSSELIFYISANERCQWVG